MHGFHLAAAAAVFHIFNTNIRYLTLKHQAKFVADDILFLLLFITKTYLYNFVLLKPHFYIVKLGFTGVYIIFPISAQNIDRGYSLEPMFFSKNMKNYQSFYLKIFSFWR